MRQDNQREAYLYAYLAGIIDGEGTIRIEKANRIKTNWVPRYSAAICAVNTNQEVIELLRQTFTPQCNMRKVEVLQSRKPCYRWGTSGSQITQGILEKLLPFLVIKRSQAELVLEFCRKKKSFANFKGGVSKEELLWREEFYQKVKKLNATGAPATTNQEHTREGEVIV